MYGTTGGTYSPRVFRPIKIIYFDSSFDLVQTAGLICLTGKFLLVSHCWKEIIFAQYMACSSCWRAFETSYTDNHVSYWSILLSHLCHTTVGDHLFPDQSGKSFGTGLWRTRRKLWTSCSTDQTGGDQKRRGEKIKEKKERKSHCSTQNKPSHRAWWTSELRNRVRVGFILPEHFMIEIVYMGLPFIFSGIRSSFFAYKYGIHINSLKKI